MAIKANQIKQLTASGVVTTAGKTGRLKAVIFTGVTVGDSLIVLDGGSGGTERIRLLTAVVNRSETFDIPAGGAIFATDIYATISLTGVGYATFVYDELED